MAPARGNARRRGRIPWLQPDFAGADRILRLASHTFAIEADGLRILVDTGIGNGKDRANPAWHRLRTDYLGRLEQAGFSPRPSTSSS